jgi:hypothetical protein
MMGYGFDGRDHDDFNQIIVCVGKTKKRKIKVYSLGFSNSGLDAFCDQKLALLTNVPQGPVGNGTVQPKSH